MRKRKASLSLIIAVVAVLSVAAAGCNPEQMLEQIKGKAGGGAIASTDGLSQITVPPGWKKQTSLNDVAVLQAALPQQEMYVIVITEAKEDFADEMTRQKYSDVTRERLVKTLSSPKVTLMPDLKVDGKPALQYRIQGTTQNLNVVYFHTVVESKQYFHYLLAWTLKSRFEKNEPTLQQVIRSFKEAA